MSRLYDAMLDSQPCRRPSNAGPMVYYGELTGTVYMQHLEAPFLPVVIGNVRQAEDLRDRLTAFLEGMRLEESKL